MSRYIDKETLMELLDSNDLSEAQKLELARAYTAQQRRSNTAEGAKMVADMVVSVVRTIVDQVVNHRALQTVFSSPLMRVQH